MTLNRVLWIQRNLNLQRKGHVCSKKKDNDSTHPLNTIDSASSFVFSILKTSTAEFSKKPLGDIFLSPVYTWAQQIPATTRCLLTWHGVLTLNLKCKLPRLTDTISLSTAWLSGRQYCGGHWAQPSCDTVVVQVVKQSLGSKKSECVIVRPWQCMIKTPIRVWLSPWLYNYHPIYHFESWLWKIWDFLFF